MVKPLIVLGTARQNGETRRAINIAFPSGSAALVNLGDRKIAGYDYAHANITDDFFAVVEEMLPAQVVIFATPVYWYAMSASLKAFFDRLTDLLEIAKDKGRALAAKEVWLLATGTDDALPDGFEVPFRRTADYFAMRYMGAAYLYTGNKPEQRRSSEAAVSRFGRAILETVHPPFPSPSD